MYHLNQEATQRSLSITSTPETPAAHLYLSTATRISLEIDAGLDEARVHLSS